MGREGNSDRVWDYVCCERRRMRGGEIMSAREERKRPALAISKLSNPPSLFNHKHSKQKIDSKNPFNPLLRTKRLFYPANRTRKQARKRLFPGGTSTDTGESGLEVTSGTLLVGGTVLSSSVLSSALTLGSGGSVSTSGSLGSGGGSGGSLEGVGDDLRGEVEAGVGRRGGGRGGRWVREERQESEVGKGRVG
jgi:hypothetical protein